MSNKKILLKMLYTLERMNYKLTKIALLLENSDKEGISEMGKEEKEYYRKLKDRACKICGHAFSGTGKRLYCSQKCQKEGKRQSDKKRKRKNKKIRYCQVCGGRIINRGKIHRIRYCSQECAEEAQHRQMREWRENVRKYAGV